MSLNKEKFKMAEFKISWTIILKIAALIIKFILSGMSETEAVSKAAEIKGVSFNKAMKMWKKYNR